jgi:protoheme IX farnesyltransferase
VFTIAPALWGMFGVFYLAAAGALGALFIWLAWRLRRERTSERARALFHYSLAYLALLFVAMAVDPMLL